MRLRALALAREAIELDPLAAFAWIALSRCFLGLGEIQEAVAAADKGLAINPDHAWGHYVRGMALWQVNRAEDAVAAFDAALASTPHEEIRGGIMAGRACALVLMERYDEAYEWSRKAQLEPHAGRLAYLGEITALGLTGRHSEAADAVERAKNSDELFDYANVFHDLPLTDAKARQKITDGLVAAGMG